MRALLVSTLVLVFVTAPAPTQSDRWAIVNVVGAGGFSDSWVSYASGHLERGRFWEIEYRPASGDESIASRQGTPVSRHGPHTLTMARAGAETSDYSNDFGPGAGMTSTDSGPGRCEKK